ncbi:MAG: AAA family ATPase [Anaerolineae bacterium]|nr:AAA family ATPase [Anaerolineae bacterium]
MARLSIHLMGPMQVALGGQMIARFETEKTRALLAYLAVEADRPHRRDLLAEMLWPERPEGAASANLRHTLASLRRAIGDTPDALGAGRQAVPPFLLATRQTIQFNSASDAWVDVGAFLALLRTTQPTDQLPVQSLEEAVGLCRGTFLEDVSVTDCAEFEEWLLLTRERLRRLALDALHQLANDHEQLGQWDRALQHAWQEVALEPWDERAQRQVMRLLALTGQRNAALAQYETCRTTLAGELGVEPETETTRLFERIRDGEVGTSSPAREHAVTSRLPRFMLESARESAPPVFVAREHELSRLTLFLDQALEGTGRVVFVTGGPGQGKTALLGEFARRAMSAHPGLLVAWGDCNAYSGAGDPYLPFRDVMGMLTGDLETRWLAGSIGCDHARRQWNALPLVVPTLLASGSSLIGILLDGNALRSRVAAALPERADWLERLRALSRQARSGGQDLERSFLFEQCTSMLRAVAEHHPLVLILDDIQWADSASLGLLFHLGRRLARAGNRILIACAYRPEELALGRAGERHPLEKVLYESKRALGNVWVDLDVADETADRGFMDALLDTEPNQLGEGFREALFHRTAGHPLFTIELLRALQERGDLVRSEADGAWIEGPEIGWEELPARVEAVIEERVSRLEPRLREIVSIASVEGERFTAQVVAAVQNAAQWSLLQDLTRLEKLHRLVMEQGEVQIGSRRAVRYRFGHALVQEYVYRCLGRGERRLLHGQVAAALETLYEGHQDEIAVQLAEHLLRADDHGAALHYFALAAESAARRYAHEEAITLYTQAVQLAHRVGLDASALADLHRRRGLAYKTLGEFERARADLETAVQTGRTAGERRAEWRALLALGRLWTLRDYGQGQGFVDQALELAYHIGDPVVLAESLNRVGNWHLNGEDLPAAIAYHQQALAIVEQVGDRGVIASTLDLLGLASLIRGDVAAGVGYYDRAISLFRELEDRAALGASLVGRGVATCGANAMPAVLLPAGPIAAHNDLAEALQLAREIASPSAEAWALCTQSIAYTGQGQFGRALEAAHAALEIATAIGHREWMVGSQSALGALYADMLAPEEARPQLEQALALAERLQSRHWIHHATGSLAVACWLLDDLAQARAYLDAVLSPETAMDSVHKRTCWARRAELALREGDPSLALEIVERLIGSAPGMSPGRVIAFLWKVKAEALAAVGQTEQAGILLQAAVENAQATGERSLLWPLHASLARLYGRTHRRSEAAKEFAAAHQLIQELADTIPAPGLREGFLRRAHGMLEPVL